MRLVRQTDFAHNEMPQHNVLARCPVEMGDGVPVAIERYWSGAVTPKADVNDWEWLSSYGLQAIASAAYVDTDLRIRPHALWAIGLSC